MPNEIPEKDGSAKPSNKTCGIIMPISGTPEYGADHWAEVLSVIIEVAESKGFSADLVSNSDTVGLIHERIVNNIYDNDIVVVDVSSKNPNVMFELGLRLAFDKPTIIIKDEKTGYSFDTGVIEHIPYPSSLRHSGILKLKEELGKKMVATHEKKQNDPHFSPFLKSFGRKMVPGTIQPQLIPESKYIVDKLENLSIQVQKLSQTPSRWQIKYGRSGQRTIHSSDKVQPVPLLLDGWSEHPDGSRRYTFERSDGSFAQLIKAKDSNKIDEIIIPSPAKTGSFWIPEEEEG